MDGINQRVQSFLETYFRNLTLVCGEWLKRKTRLNDNLVFKKALYPRPYFPGSLPICKVKPKSKLHNGSKKKPPSRRKAAKGIRDYRMTMSFKVATDGLGPITVARM